MSVLKEGSQAPDFKLDSTEGKSVSLKDFVGKQNVVIYFYPKDNTSGCTRESCDFRDSTKFFEQFNTVVFGVSGDTVDSHRNFQGKYNLSFPLLSDPGKKIHKVYGAFGKKIMYGKEVEGTIRSTFVIGTDGLIKKVFSPVRVDGHVDKVLEAVKELA